MWKRNVKGLEIWNFALLLVVLKWHHGSERVNVRSVVKILSRRIDTRHPITGHPVCHCRGSPYLRASVHEIAPIRIYLFIRLFERLISRWALSDSQWQLQCYRLCVCALVVYDSEWVTAALNSTFLISPRLFTALFCCYVAGATWNCCRLGAGFVCTLYNHELVLLCHFIRSHIIM